MQATTSGPNRTGAALSPELEQAMNEAADALTPATAIDTSEMEANKLRYIAEAEAVGSVPPPISAEEASEPVGADPGPSPMFLDKLGERIAFERTGTRLYDALIVKYRASRELDGGELAPVAEGQASSGAAGRDLGPHSRRGTRALQHALRGDAIAGRRPDCADAIADVSAVASSGILQVLNDPRTTLDQCLGAMLTAELTDNAGWELLAGLAEDAGESELAGQFLGALSQEQEHLAIVKGWLTAIVSEQPQLELL